MVFTLRRLTARRAGVVIVLLAAFLSPVAVRAKEKSVSQLMAFAAEMAKGGNWREARFRWEAAARIEPDNPRILNNLAVAQEALGDMDSARESYGKALALSPWDKLIVENHGSFDRFQDEYAARDETDPEEEDLSDIVPMPAKKLKTKGKAIKTTVGLPVPARLDVSEDRTLLVVSFLTGESAFMDVNRELVRFLRGEFRKRSDLDVLGISPPPAVPEQRLEDLIANREFWRHIGREYGADLIVSGLVRYDRNDFSGFRDVDMVSPTTGQKVRQSRFVEQEKFRYEIDVIFMDGSTGELRFRDRLSRSIVFQGTQNDPITAFYELSESLAPDVLAIVKARVRYDHRFIFKR